MAGSGGRERETLKRTRAEHGAEVGLDPEITI